MKKITTLLILFYCMMNASFTPAFSQKKSISEAVNGTENKTVVTEIDKDKLTKFLSYLNKEGKWQGSVALMQNGKLLYSKAFGKIAENNRREADSGTKYRIGSITKMYTATLIYELIEKNKLTLDTPVATYFPKIPNADQIAIRHLLAHTSGLHNYTNDSDFDVLVPHSREEMLNRFENQKPSFRPGADYEYSNTNYYLLALIIEKVSERTYEEQIKTKILAPRILMSTRIDDNEVNPNQNEAISWVKNYEDDTWDAVPLWDLTNALGAGDISSSAPDVARFLDGLFSNEIIPEKQVENFLTVDRDGRGMGAMAIPFYDKISFGHTGGLEGFRSVASYFPDEQLSFALLSNALDMDNNDVAIGILSIVFNKPYEFPEFSDEKKLIDGQEQYVGHYTSEEIPLEIEIFSVDGSLFGQATGQTRFPLSKNTEGDLFFKLANITMKFSQLEDGKYQEMILVQGKEYPYTRKK